MRIEHARVSGFGHEVRGAGFAAPSAIEIEEEAGMSTVTGSGSAPIGAGSGSRSGSGAARVRPGWILGALLACATSTMTMTTASASGFDGKGAGSATAPLAPASERFASAETGEEPDFQRHVLPLMGRLGCNGRACHGSFQGQGGFRLSLFGYDFAADHAALMEEGTDRVTVDDPEGSKILAKPTLAIPHKGGKLMEPGDWAHNLLTRWIESGAKPAAAAAASGAGGGNAKGTGAATFDRLEVTPSEIVMGAPGETTRLRVVAHWSDGSSEDVTCLTRFRTNDESIAEIDADGTVTGIGVGDTHVVAFYDNGVAPVPVILPVTDRHGPNYPDVPARTRVDELIVEKLRKLGITPSELAGDAEFLRRASLDLTGTPPSPSEIEAFLADSTPTAEKRARKIDELLERPSYAAYWATKLCDYTGNTDRNFQGQPGAQSIARHWYSWIEKRVRENMPYDELIEGIVLARGREPGQTFEQYCEEMGSYFRDRDPADFAERETMPFYWGRRNARTPEDKALAFAYSFLGTRLECAQCHKHPFDQWTKQDFERFTEFFRPVRYGRSPEYNRMLRGMRDDETVKGENNGQINRELERLARAGRTVPWDELIVTTPNAPRRARVRGQGNAGPVSRVITPKLLGGDEVDVTRAGDPREPLMDWMRSEENPYFARAFVNRVWANYFHVGIVNPPDDQNLANPPSNQALLDHLVRGFTGSGYDMKWLHREILNSDAYQRSWRSNESNRLDERNFSRAVVRRLPAEVVLDAIELVTANDATLATAHENLARRAIGVFGETRAQREGFAATVFGETKRDTNCDCSRSNEPNLLQAIFLQNDERDLLQRIERRDGWLAELAARGAEEANRARRERQRDADDLTERLARLRENAAKQQENLASLRMNAERNQPKIAEVQARLAQTRRQIEQVRTRIAAQRGNAGAGAGDGKVAGGALREPVEQVAREAYLRVLGRPPGDEELAIAKAHIEGAATPIDGTRDLIWALINTKEFVTNH